MWYFTDPTSVPCDATGEHLYCFQIDHQTPVSVKPPAKARLAFVSTTTIPITGGLAAGDAACAKDAAAAKLPGTYKALMATTNDSPLSRFDLKGDPWVRVDGVALDVPFMSAPLDIRADGTQYGQVAFVGAPDDLSNVGQYTCNDWQSTNPNDNLSIGMTDWTYGFLYIGIGCDSGPRPVYCMQQ
jgi:hypothetical protein